MPPIFLLASFGLHDAAVTSQWKLRVLVVDNGRHTEFTDTPHFALEARNSYLRCRGLGQPATLPLGGVRSGVGISQLGQVGLLLGDYFLLIKKLPKARKERIM